MPITPSSKAWPLLVGQVFEAADRARPDRVDEHVEFAIPSVTELGEYTVDLIGIDDVGYQPKGIGAAAISQVCGRAIEVSLGPGDDRDAGAVVR
jgi:hypothetical protein